MTLLASGAQAAFEVHDSHFGEDTLVVDTNTGIAWLRLDLTYGMSFNDVVGQLGTGQTFEGFQVDSIHDMMIASHIPHPTGPANPTSEELQLITDFARLMGGIQYGTAFSLTGFDGIRVQPSDCGGEPICFPGIAHTMQLSIGPTSGSWYDESHRFYPNEAYATAGTFLRAIAPVPEPSTYALLIAGFLAVGIASRKKLSGTPH